MNDHHRFRELLGPRVLGLLEPDEERQLQRHLAGCRMCREEEAELHVVHRGLTNATTPPPSELKDRITGRSRRRRWQTSGAIAAAAILLVVLFLGSVYPALLRPQDAVAAAATLSYYTSARSERRSASRRNRRQHAHKAPSFGAVPAPIRRVLRDVVPERRQEDKLRRVHGRFRGEGHRHHERPEGRLRGIPVRRHNERGIDRKSTPQRDVRCAAQALWISPSSTLVGHKTAQNAASLTTVCCPLIR